MALLQRVSGPLLVFALLAACAPPAPSGGDSGDDGDATTTGAPPPDPGSTSSASATGDDPGAEPLPDPFDLDRVNLRLLPFAIRFKRLQQLLGVGPDDPAFAVLLARRYELGDYNYALGVSPDLTWNATRMQVWVAALRPICDSPAMHARFPAFPDRLDELLTAAYGVAPTAEQLAGYEDLLGNAAFDDPTRYQLVCMVALSALEFVAQ